MQSSTPMTLAETASIFCETIITRRALQDATGNDRLAILEASLQGACQVVVDISSRFLFESRTIEKRRERALTPDEMGDIMRQAQLETYGDGLDPNKLHPFMWAAKPHYYSDYAFYNFPYMFGQLFALGLYRVYQESPSGFQTRYDELLSRTGMAMANDLTKSFGIDISQKSFWAGSLDVLAEDIDAFCDLAN
jgi:oligoendopeptidase F